MDRFTPIAVVVTVLMDIGLNSLLEPVSAHISVVILLTCLQVPLAPPWWNRERRARKGGRRAAAGLGRGSARVRARDRVRAHTQSMGIGRAVRSTSEPGTASRVCAGRRLTGQVLSRWRCRCVRWSFCSSCSW